MGSNQSKDVQIRFSIPVIVTGEDGKPGDCKPCGSPWGAPGEISAAKEILVRTGALLDVLQKAQREGQLTEAGLCELESLQRFYTALKCQVDGKQG